MAMCLSMTGFEARGFIFGAPLALALDCAFVPLRKPGKLPGAVIHPGISAQQCMSGPARPTLFH